MILFDLTPTICTRKWTCSRRRWHPSAGERWTFLLFERSDLLWWYWYVGSVSDCIRVPAVYRILNLHILPSITCPCISLITTKAVPTLDPDQHISWSATIPNPWPFSRSTSRYVCVAQVVDIIGIGRFILFCLWCTAGFAGPDNNSPTLGLPSRGSYEFCIGVSSKHSHVRRQIDFLIGFSQDKFNTFN